MITTKQSGLNPSISFYFSDSNKSSNCFSHCGFSRAWNTLFIVIDDGSITAFWKLQKDKEKLWKYWVQYSFSASEHKEWVSAEIGNKETKKLSNRTPG